MSDISADRVPSEQPTPPAVGSKVTVEYGIPDFAYVSVQAEVTEVVKYHPDSGAWEIKARLLESVTGYGNDAESGEVRTFWYKKKN